ncbi:MAG: hypothetical protein KJ000_21420 [Pirellulaceae bacterium]|nr:hypothetical protein [Pirellulaceae bacterium]
MPPREPIAEIDTTAIVSGLRMMLTQSEAERQRRHPCHGVRRVVCY